MGGQFVDNDDRRRSAQRLSMAVWVQCGTARGLIPPLDGMAAEVFAARRGQRSPTVRSGSVAVVARSTPTRLRLGGFAAAVMPGTHAVDCAECRVAAALRVARRYLDRQWWGRTT
jgi:hypothetical protein